MATLAAALTLAVAGAGAGPSRRQPASPCPAVASLTRQPQRVEDVVRAVRRLVPRTYPDSRGFVIRYVAWLGDDRAGPDSLRAAARTRCGARVTRLSWGVGLQFPLARTASGSFSDAAVTHTRAGWRLWLRLG